MRHILTAVLFLLAFNVSHMSQAQESRTFAKEYSAVWNRAKDYTLELAEKMPEAEYGFKATPEIMSFREHLVHLVDNFTKLQTYVTGKRDCPLLPKLAKAKEMDKAELIALMGEAFEYIDQLALQTPDSEMTAPTAEPFFAKGIEMNKRKVFLLLRDHVTHHRAQLIIYLRLKGIKPPRYRGW